MLLLLCLFQVIFRPDPKKFKRLIGELKDFSERVKALLFYIDNSVATEPLQTIERACDWQVLIIVV